MAIVVQQRIEASRERVWAIISDHRHWAEVISGIQKVEVLDPGAEDLLGFRWRETRVMFGKEAVETMWITAAEPGRWYETTAHNHGMIYTTRMAIDGADAGPVELSMQFSARPTTLMARLMMPLAWLFNGAVRKALQQDLRDIQVVAEAR